MLLEMFGMEVYKKWTKEVHQLNGGIWLVICWIAELDGAEVSEICRMKQYIKNSKKSMRNT